MKVLTVGCRYSVLVQVCSWLGIVLLPRIRCRSKNVSLVLVTEKGLNSAVVFLGRISFVIWQSPLVVFSVRLDSGCVVCLQNTAASGCLVWTGVALLDCT